MHATGREISSQRHPVSVWAFMAFLVSAMFAGQDLGLPLPVAPYRLLLAASLGLWLIDRRETILDLRIRAVHIFGGAMVLTAVLSAFSVGTLLTSLGFYALLDRLVLPLVLFSLAPMLLRRAADRLLLLKTLTLIGLYLGGTAVGETVGPSGLVWPEYILDSSVGIQFGRARGPFVQSEANGMILAACLFAALALVKVAPTWRWRRVGQLAMLAASVGALLTLTRSVWLGVVVGVVGVMLVDRSSRRVLASGMVVTAIASLVVLAGSDSLADEASERATTSRSFYDRANTNSAAIRAVQANPLTGIGWSRFAAESGNFVRQNDEYPITNTNIEIHNVFLSRAAELGLPGAVLWILLALTGLGWPTLRRAPFAAPRMWRSVLVGAGATWLAAAMLSPAPYPLPNYLVWVLAGLASADLIVQPGSRSTHELDAPY